MKRPDLHNSLASSAMTFLLFTGMPIQAAELDEWEHREEDTAQSAVADNNHAHTPPEPSNPSKSAASECRRIEGKLASIVQNECLERNLVITGGVSVNGALILYKEYPPLPSRSPHGRVLLIGGIHGDEYSSVSIVFKWMKILDKFHSGLFHWHVVPLLNPDGLLREKSQRMNANGVDLNRNFPMPDWDTETADYWLHRTDSDPRRYPGKSALSEPETHWLAREIEQFNPDVIVTVHAPHGVVDYDGPKNAPYRLGRLYLSLIGTYPGSLGNYAGIQKHIPVVTIELPYAGSMPTSTEINNIWVDLVNWLRRNLGTQIRSVEKNQETEPS